MENPLLFKSVVEAAAEGLSIVDAENKFVYCSPSMSAMLGVPETHLLGRKAESFLDASEAERAVALWKKPLYTREQFRILRPDGSALWVDIAAHPLRLPDSDGRKLLEWHDITSLKDRESQMVKAEEKAHQVLEAAQDYAFILLDNQGHISTWSQGAEKLLGYSEAEILGKKNDILFTPEDREINEPSREMGMALSQGRAEDERWHLRKDGSRFYASGVLTALRDSEGGMVGFCKVMRDMTEKWIAQEDLRQSQEFYTGLVDSIDGILWEADGESKQHTFVSKKAETLLGFPLDKWFGPDYWSKLVYEEDRETVLQAWENAVRDKKGYTVDFRIVDAQGRKRWFRDYVSVVETPDGPLKLRAVLVEVSSQKEAARRQEIQLQVTHILALSSSIPKAAQEILSLMAMTWEWEVGVFWHADRKTHVLAPVKSWRKPGSTKVVGGEPPLLQKPQWISDLAAMPDKERPLWMQAALERGFRSFFGFPILAGDGTQAVLEFFASEPKAEEGEVLEMASIIGGQIGPFLDRIRAEEALRESQEQLLQSQKMEAVGRLAGGVAHDFNNLLTAINGYSDMILSRLEPESPLVSQVEEISKAGHRAAALTNQLLAYSRRQVLAPQIVNLNTVISEMGNMLKRLIGEDIQLDMRLSPDLRPVKIDPGQMGQVIMNLAVNSRDAMPTGGHLILETANAAVSDSPEDIPLNLPPGDYARITVTDTGRGMPESTKAHLFEPFFTTKEAGKGTGLGLSTVEGIIQQSGGGISVRSEVGKGTAFNLYLPVEREGRFPAPMRENPGLLYARDHETILLVEDEVAVRNLAREILTLHGYHVLSAASGAEALQIEQGYHATIHLLLTDFIMEGMNGRQVYEAILAHRPEIKAIFMSGYTEDAISRHGIETSDLAFLPKPFSPKALVDKVFRTLVSVEVA